MIKGSHLTKENKRKISEAHKGKHYPKLSEAKKGIPTWNKGKKMSEDTKRKMSISKRIYLEKNPNALDYARSLSIKKIKGSKFTDEHKNKIGNALKGRKFSDETKLKLSESRKGQRNSPSTEFKIGDKRISGVNNPNWNNGSSFEPYGNVFNKRLKEQIRKRDGYRCQECFRHQDELFTKNKNGKIVNQKLHVHHIDYDKKNCNQSNLISLCRNCHTQTNFDREDWINYFNNMEVNKIC